MAREKMVDKFITEDSDDTIEKAKIRIDLEHYEVHEGDAFQVSTVVAAAADLSVAFKTGAKEIHMVISYAAESKAHIQYLEGGVITATTGTERVAYNRNRRSSNAPTILQNKSGAYVADSKVLEDATVSAGTIFGFHYNWGDKKAGKERRGAMEWILEVDTVYEFLLTSDDGSKGLHIGLRWYEVEV